MSSVDELLDLNPSYKREWKEAEFAVYLYSPNMEKQKNDAKLAGAGFSLSLVGSSISPDREHLLREQVATRMSQGTLYFGNGQVTMLDPELFPPPSQSYYCLVDISETSQTGQTGSEEPVRQFLVCFVSIGKQGLDLFRSELDNYCEELRPLLKQLPSEDTSMAFPGSPLEAKVKQWFSQNVLYLSRVVQQCHSQLPIFLHTAMNSQVEVTGPDTEVTRDVRQFLEACSLASLMQFSTNQAEESASSLGDRDSIGSSSQPNTVRIHVTSNGCSISSEESSKFCSNWTQVLLSQGMTSPDPFFLRQAVENYKLRIIQDINALKRLLRQAESDYHALYRCYVFLCVCGNGKLLLQCAVQEARTLHSPDTLSVLQALQIYTEKWGFKNVKT